MKKTNIYRVAAALVIAIGISACQNGGSQEPTRSEQEVGQTSTLETETNDTNHVASSKPCDDYRTDRSAYRAADAASTRAVEHAREARDVTIRVAEYGNIAGARAVADAAILAVEHARELGDTAHARANAAIDRAIEHAHQCRDAEAADAFRDAADDYRVIADGYRVIADGYRDLPTDAVAIDRAADAFRDAADAHLDAVRTAHLAAERLTE